jgi:hypothetical protein
MQSKRIFSAMLDDIIFDVALQAHHEVLKGKAICQVCQTRYVLLFIYLFYKKGALGADYENVRCGSGTFGIYVSQERR